MPQPKQSEERKPTARTSPVRRRSVFYVSGFDPQGPGHYHRLFVEQAALQSAVTDYDLEVGPRRSPRPNVSAWAVTFKTRDGDVVHNDYQFLRWDDVVREHWPRGRFRLAKVTLATTLRLLINGSWLSMCRVSWVAGLTLALPTAVGLLALSSLVAGAALAWPIVRGSTAPWPSVIAALAALGMPLMLPTLWRYGQGDWLMRSTASLLRHARGQAPEINARVDAWSEVLRESIVKSDSDEVLIVAHSSGCIGAVAALSRALKVIESNEGVSKPLSLLTLGQCMPVLSHQPEAKAFRAALAHLAQFSALTWVDVSAPPDACCFALSDPCANPYSAGHEASLVKRLSPRYAEQIDSLSYRELKRDKFRCHFQYLMAFSSPRHYDFFKWVCGPDTLDQTTHRSSSVTNFKRFSW